jgi:hypothetical protein
MRKVFEKYYDKILKGYFTARRDLWKTDQTAILYLPLEYVNIGDILGNYSRNDFKVHQIYTDPKTGKDIVDIIDSKGNIQKRAYYDDRIGLGVKYDKIKHNPI